MNSGYFPDVGSRSLILHTNAESIAVW
jgi:hypothetical protein